jgi:hypothetical protein
MPPIGRVLLKIPLKTIGDRRARRAVPTVPPSETEFTADEQDVFRGLERRGLPRPEARSALGSMGKVTR